MLGEGFGADHHDAALQPDGLCLIARHGAARGGVQPSWQQRPADKHNPRQRRQGRHDAVAAAGGDFIAADDLVEQDGEQGRGDTPKQHSRPVSGLQAGEDIITEAGRPDRRGQNRRADHPDDRRADAGDNGGQGQWQFHLDQALARRHADAARGLAHDRVNALKADNRVPEHRQNAVERQRHKGRGKADRAAQNRHHQRQKGETGNGLQRTCNAECGTGEPFLARRENAQRQADQDGAGYRCHGQAHMAAKILRQDGEGFGQLFAHGACSSAATARACFAGAARSSVTYGSPGRLTRSDGVPV